jgi:hypothetical protein
MTKLTIVRKLTDAERELRRMEVQLKKHVSRGRKRPFTQLRGLWKEAGAISELDAEWRGDKLRSGDSPLPFQPHHP